MTEDPRCCGSGMCIINADGQCWCGQRWNGQRMAPVPLAAVGSADPVAGRDAVRADKPQGTAA